MKSSVFSLLLGFTLLISPLSQAANPVWKEGSTFASYDITVYRSASCGCCKAWNDHLRDHQFRVEDVVLSQSDLNARKQELGVPAQAASCHTAVVNGKVIEGHVPAQDIKRLLASEDAKKVHLLTVPGMPQGGPGMDYEGAGKDDFKVWALTQDGKARVFQAYENY